MAPALRAPEPPRFCAHPGPDGHPLHQHGTIAAYRRDQCRCHPCQEAKRTYERSVARAKAYGRWAPWTDPAPARAHALALRAAGMSLIRMEAATGVGHAALGRIITGKDRGKPVTQIRVEVAARILAVPVPARPLPGPTVPAIGSVRRLQALACLGWSLRAIGERIGVDRRNLAGIMRQERVTRATESAIRGVYDDLWDKKAPERDTLEKYSAARARGDAARRGWVPPMAWDDGSIDDPGARPQGTVGALKGRRAQVVEDCEVIASDGGTLQGAAQRLGMHQSNLTRSLYRAGRADLVAALTRQARGEDAPGGTRGVARARRARAS